MRPDEQFEGAGFTDIQVDLQEPNLATVVINGVTTTGTWTMMYDQAFIIETALFRFVANFKYTVKPENVENVSKFTSSSYALFNTQCNATMVGVQ